MNLSSLQANQTFMDVNANNVANVNTDGFIPTDTRMTNNQNSVQANTTLADNNGSLKSQTDLTKELTDQITIGGVEKANVSAIKTQDEMFGSLLDIKA
jgi:flagellar hook protein FlgE